VKKLVHVKYFIQERPFYVINWKLQCRLFNKKIPQKVLWQQLFAGKRGLEIGGPSRMFFSSGFLPLYPIIQSLDGVNFNNNTIWEGKLEEGENFIFENRKGYQYITEGTNLHQIKDKTFDFVLSCNNLEHIANPIKAVNEWARVLKHGGTLQLVLPRKESNFDHNRKVSSFSHIIEDYEKDVQEDDLTHLPEILKLHDLKRDPHAGSFESFKERSENNFQFRSLHHHVFDIDLLTQIVSFAGLKPVLNYSSPTDHFIAAVK